MSLCNVPSFCSILVQNLNRMGLGLEPARSRGRIGPSVLDSSWKFRGYVKEISWLVPGKYPEPIRIFWNSQETSWTFPGHFLDFFLEMSRKFPGHFLAISRTFPGIFQFVSVVFIVCSWFFLVFPLPLSIFTREGFSQIPPNLFAQKELPLSIFSALTPAWVSESGVLSRCCYAWVYGQKIGRC